MKFKKDNNLQNNEQASNKKVADMLLSNLLKGKAIQESEEVPATDPSDVINDNDPNSTIQVKQKSYAIDKKIGMTSASSLSSSSSSAIKEFMKESNILDNELNQFITELQINHSDDVYKNVADKVMPTDNNAGNDTESEDEPFEGGAMHDNEVDRINESYLNALSYNELDELSNELEDQVEVTSENIESVHDHLSEEEANGVDENENEQLYDHYENLSKRIAIEREKNHLVKNN